MQQFLNLTLAVLLLFSYSTEADAGQLFRGGCKGGCSSAGACGMSGCPDCASCSGQASGATIPPGWQKVCFGPGDCRLVRISGASQAASPTQATWEPFPGEPSLSTRWIGGVQVGLWDASKSTYRTYDATAKAFGRPVYGASAEAAVQAASQQPTQVGSLPQATPQAGAMNDGPVQPFMIDGTRGLQMPPMNTLTVNGQKILESDVTGKGGANLPDLRQRYWLTAVVHNPHQRAQVKAELEASPWASKCWVKVYSDTDWEAEGYKLGESEQFTKTGIVYFLQEPKGADGYAKASKSVWHYASPKELETLLGDVKNAEVRVNPDFHPDRVPTPKSGNTTFMAFAGCLLFAGAGLMYWNPKKKTPAVESVESEDEQP